ncbi:MAG: stage II sporulation protein R [Clostridia bacterium]|nr:stage II sporulation protein R [Clostridia bacterium]
MKKLICVFAVITSFAMVLSGCSHNNVKNLEVLRFHIRANSNSSRDQYIKYLIKDKIVELMSPMLDKVESFEDAKNLANKSANVIEEYANHLLRVRGFEYGAKVSIGENYFDEREIDGVTFESGFYESMIVELGDGLGNNWWGLIFPNFSYIPQSVKNGEEILYKSKIVEIYNSLI